MITYNLNYGMYLWWKKIRNVYSFETYTIYPTFAISFTDCLKLDIICGATIKIR